METVKNKIREFGVFIGLMMFPIILIVIGAYTFGQSISNYYAGYIQLFPTDFYNGGLICSLFGCLILIGLGSYVLWSAIPSYKEYLTKCGSK